MHMRALRHECQRSWQQLSPMHPAAGPSSAIFDERQNPHSASAGAFEDVDRSVNHAHDLVRRAREVKGNADDFLERLARVEKRTEMGPSPAGVRAAQAKASVQAKIAAAAASKKAEKKASRSHKSDASMHKKKHSRRRRSNSPELEAKTLEEQMLEIDGNLIANPATYLGANGDDDEAERLRRAARNFNGISLEWRAADYERSRGEAQQQPQHGQRTLAQAGSRSRGTNLESTINERAAGRRAEGIGAIGAVASSSLSFTTNAVADIANAAGVKGTIDDARSLVVTRVQDAVTDAQIALNGNLVPPADGTVAGSLYGAASSVAHQAKEYISAPVIVNVNGETPSGIAGHLRSTAFRIGSAMEHIA